jgi:hypothetical protein
VFSIQDPGQAAEQRHVDRRVHLRVNGDDLDSVDQGAKAIELGARPRLSTVGVD